jgi:class 3 adenylate cyclase
LSNLLKPYSGEGALGEALAPDSPDDDDEEDEQDENGRGISSSRSTSAGAGGGRPDSRARRLAMAVVGGGADGAGSSSREASVAATVTTKPRQTSDFSKVALAAATLVASSKRLRSFASDPFSSPQQPPDEVGQVAGGGRQSSVTSSSGAVGTGDGLTSPVPSSSPPPSSKASHLPFYLLAAAAEGGDLHLVRKAASVMRIKPQPQLPQLLPPPTDSPATIATAAAAALTTPVKQQQQQPKEEELGGEQPAAGPGVANTTTSGGFVPSLGSSSSEPGVPTVDIITARGQTATANVEDPAIETARPSVVPPSPATAGEKKEPGGAPSAASCEASATTSAAAGPSSSSRRFARAIATQGGARNLVARVGGAQAGDNGAVNASGTAPITVTVDGGTRAPNADAPAAVKKKGLSFLALVTAASGAEKFRQVKHGQGGGGSGAVGGNSREASVGGGGFGDSGTAGTRGRSTSENTGGGNNKRSMRSKKALGAAIASALKPDLDGFSLVFIRKHAPLEPLFQVEHARRFGGGNYPVPPSAAMMTGEAKDHHAGSNKVPYVSGILATFAFLSACFFLLPAFASGPLAQAGLAMGVLSFLLGLFALALPYLEANKAHGQRLARLYLFMRDDLIVWLLFPFRCLLFVLCFPCCFIRSYRQTVRIQPALEEGAAPISAAAAAGTPTSGRQARGSLGSPILSLASSPVPTAFYRTASVVFSPNNGADAFSPGKALASPKSPSQGGPPGAQGTGTSASSSIIITEEDPEATRLILVHMRSVVLFSYLLLAQITVAMTTIAIGPGVETSPIINEYFTWQSWYPYVSYLNAGTIVTLCCSALYLAGLLFSKARWLFLTGLLCIIVSLGVDRSNDWVTAIVWSIGLLSIGVWHGRYLEIKTKESYLDQRLFQEQAARTKEMLSALLPEPIVDQMLQQEREARKKQRAIVLMAGSESNNNAAIVAVSPPGGGGGLSPNGGGGDFNSLSPTSPHASLASSVSPTPSMKRFAAAAKAVGFASRTNSLSSQRRIEAAKDDNAAAAAAALEDKDSHGNGSNERDEDGSQQAGSEAPKDEEEAIRATALGDLSFWKGLKQELFIVATAMGLGGCITRLGARCSCCSAARRSSRRQYNWCRAQFLRCKRRVAGKKGARSNSQETGIRLSSWLSAQNAAKRSQSNAALSPFSSSSPAAPRPPVEGGSMMLVGATSSPSPTVADRGVVGAGGGAGAAAAAAAAGSIFIGSRSTKTAESLFPQAKPNAQGGGAKSPVPLMGSSLLAFRAFSDGPANMPRLVSDIPPTNTIPPPSSSAACSGPSAAGGAAAPTLTDKEKEDALAAASGLTMMTEANHISTGGNDTTMNTTTVAGNGVGINGQSGPQFYALAKATAAAVTAGGSAEPPASLDYRKPAKFDAALLQLDLVGFTAMSASVGPRQMLEILDRLFASFDKIIQKRGALKVALVGDAVIVASGLPTRLPLSVSCRVVAKIGLDMLRTLDAFQNVMGAAKLKNHKLRARIGIHCGPVLAGVLGDRCPSYQVFGETLDICQSLESGGEPGAVHASAEVLRHLEAILPDGTKAAPDIKVIKRMEDGTGFIGRDRAAAAELGIPW